MTLKKLTEKYRAELSALAELENAVIEAEQNLVTLENDTELDFDTVKSQAEKLNRVIEKSKFEKRAITKRLENISNDLHAATDAADAAHFQSLRDTAKERRAVYKAAIESDEWKAIRKKLSALAALQGGYYETAKKELLGYAPSAADMKEAVRELNLWIDDPEESDELLDAKATIGYENKHRYIN